MFLLIFLPFPLSVEVYYLNTSNVSINHYIVQEQSLMDENLNTSNVSINRSNVQKSVKLESI